MICPRCAKEISDTETLCPYCMQEINKNLEFNDFKEDGFVQIRAKENANDAEIQNYKPRYFDISEYNIFVIAIIFVLAISVFTVFALRYMQKRSVVNEYIPKYVSTEPATTEPVTEVETTIENTVKNLSIKNLYGSWKPIGQEEKKYNALPYYTITEGGYIQENYGSIIVKGSYKDLSEKDEHGVYFSIDSALKGAYDFEVEGNDNDGYTLTLINRANGSVYMFESSKAQMKTLGTISGYRVDRNLIGTWYTKDKKKAYKFVKNGRLKRVSNNTTTYAVYTVDNRNEMIIKYMKEDIKTVTINYKLSSNGKKVVINNVEYFKKKK